MKDFPLLSLEGEEVCSWDLSEIGDNICNLLIILDTLLFLRSSGGLHNDVSEAWQLEFKPTLTALWKLSLMLLPTPENIHIKMSSWMMKDIYYLR